MRKAMKESLASCDPTRVRSRANLLAGFAQTYVLDGEIGKACRLAGEALTMATDTKCDRVVLRVRTMRMQLDPWASEPMLSLVVDPVLDGSARSTTLVV